MCLIVFAWQADDRYPLIVAANRDEFLERPTVAADWWEDGQRLAGRDLRGGGTWMGVARDGRFAALTNHRDPSSQRSGAPSRGQLVSEFLSGSLSLDPIARQAARYNGFNLIAGRWHPDPAQASLAIVAHPGPRGVGTIEPGVHGLSNASLDTPWPKVVAARDGLIDAIGGALPAEALCSALFDVLADDRVADDDRLPSTGVSRETERALSAAFIRMPGYGTRSSTVLLVDRDGEVLFIERRLEPGLPVEERRFAFRFESSRPCILQQPNPNP